MNKPLIFSLVIIISTNGLSQSPNGRKIHSQKHSAHILTGDGFSIMPVTFTTEKGKFRQAQITGPMLQDEQQQLSITV